MNRMFSRIYLLLVLGCTVISSGCGGTEGIKKYNKKRDYDFIIKEMFDFGGGAERYIGLDATSGVAIEPVPADISPRERENLVAYIKRTGIPEAALMRDDPQWKDGIAVRIDGQLIFVYCADKPAAFIRIFRFGKEAVIAYLKTAEAYRGKGYGYQLVAHAIEVLKKRGVRVIRVMTTADNAPALHLYKKSGFVEIDRFDPFSGGEKQVVLVYKW